MQHRYDAITARDLRARHSVKWRTHPPEVLPAFVAEMDFPLAEPIAAVLHDFVARGDTGYSHRGELAETYAQYAAAQHGFSPDPGRTMVIQDVLSGIRTGLQALTNPGDGVAFFVPSYPPFYSTVEVVDRRCAPVPLAYDRARARYEIDFDVLDSVLADPSVSALLLCNPHNPTGRVFAHAELTQIAQLAERHGAVVLSDEVHGPLTYDDHVHVPFASLDTAAAAGSVSFVSASKAWNVPGLKCALAIAGGPESWKALNAAPKLAAFGTSIFGVAANTAAFADGGPWLADTLGYLAGNRAAFGALLAEHLPDARWSPQDATYLAWLDCSALGLGDDPASAFLTRGKVAVNHGITFGPEGAGFVRVNLATPRPILEQVVRRLAASL